MSRPQRHRRPIGLFARIPTQASLNAAKTKKYTSVITPQSYLSVREETAPRHFFPLSRGEGGEITKKQKKGITQQKEVRSSRDLARGRTSTTRTSPSHAHDSLPRLERIWVPKPDISSVRL